jgi:hypothetical protein
MAVAKQISIYGNGVNLGRAFKEFSPTGDVEALDATTLYDTSKVYELGFKSGQVSASGVWKYDQTNVDEIHNIITAAYVAGSSVVLTASYEALAVGSPALLLSGKVTKFALPTQYGQLIMVSSDFMADNGLAFGVWVFNATAVIGSTLASTVDNGVATSNGGVFHAHAQNIDLTDLSSLSIRLQHSVDGSTWVDLVALTAFEAAQFASLSVTIAAGTTVRRYLRAAVQASGGIATVQAAFARR